MTRGSSWMRVTLISWWNSTLHGLTRPVTGAAECGSGVAASGNVSFPGEQAGGGIEADPTRAGQIDFRPGVQIGKIVRRTRGTVERFHIGLELNQIAGDKARGEPRWRSD